MLTIRLDPRRSLTQQVSASAIPGRTRATWDVTHLYRFHSPEDLLYVGVTVNPIGRWTAHSRTAVWWPLVSHVEVTQHPYMNAALDAEIEAIRTEVPLFNRRSSRRDSHSPITEHSVTLHASLIEHSVSTHASFSGGREGKGREGKRRDGSDVLTPSVCIPKIDGVTANHGGQR